jgi:hypothetical protein
LTQEKNKVLEVPMVWDGLVQKGRQKTKDGRPVLLFAPVTATIEYEFAPSSTNYFSWSWKFAEDETAVTNKKGDAYKGHFWGEPMPYDEKACSWYREEGFGVDSTVEVRLKMIQKKGGGWGTYVDTMFLLEVDDEEDTKDTKEVEEEVVFTATDGAESAPETPKAGKTQESTQQRINKGMAFNNVTHILTAWVQNPEAVETLFTRERIEQYASDFDHSYSECINGNSPAEAPLQSEENAGNIEDNGA